MRLAIVAALALPLAAPVHTPLQPLAQSVRALESALAHLGEPLSPEDKCRINDAVARAGEEAAVSEIESVLDAHTLAIVEINPESRVKVTQGRARPALVQGGTRAFLVKPTSRWESARRHKTGQMPPETRLRARGSVHREGVRLGPVLR
jgi:hypothetical protein